METKRGHRLVVSRRGLISLAGLGLLSSVLSPVMQALAVAGAGDGDDGVSAAAAYSDSDVEPSIGCYVSDILWCYSVGELEGTTVCGGDCTGAMGLMSLGGRVWWGMDDNSDPEADVFCVAGDVTSVSNSVIFNNKVKGIAAAGSIKVGGTMPAGTAVYTPRELYDWGVANNDVAKVYSPGGVYWNESARKGKVGVGAAEALRVRITADKVIDCSDYKSKVAAAMDTVTGYAATGTVKATRGDDVRIYGTRIGSGTDPKGAPYVTISKVGLVTFTGSGTSGRQVFDLDLDWLGQQATALGVKSWSFAFDRCPEGAPIFVRVKRDTQPTFTPSGGVFLDGAELSCVTNAGRADSGARYPSVGPLTQERKVAFRNLARRLMWVFPYAGVLELANVGEKSPDVVTTQPGSDWTDVDTTDGTMDSDEDRRFLLRWGINFCGSVLATGAQLTFKVAQNGRCFVNGNLAIDTNERHNTFFAPTGELTIAKSEPTTKGPLAGAVFGVYSDKACTDKLTEMTTAADGSARATIRMGTVDDIIPPDSRTVYVKELRAPAGYELRTQVDEVTVPTGGSAPLQVYDTPDGGVHVKKTATGQPSYVTDNPCYSMAGITYRVYDAETGGSERGVLTVTESGVTNSISLVPGDYWVREDVAPAGIGDGYLVDKGSHKLTADGKDHEVEVTDDPITVPMPTVRKAGRDGSPLAGATFRLEYFKAKSATGTPVAVVDVTSDANGVVDFGTAASWPWASGGKAVLPLGTIRISETKAPDGFDKASGSWTRTAVDDGSHTGSVAYTTGSSDDDAGLGSWAAGSLELAVTNEPMVGGVQVLKVATGKPDYVADNPCYSLAGITYGVFGDRQLANRKGTLTVTASGQTNPVQLTRGGTYYVREDAAPAGVGDGYKVDGDTHEAALALTDTGKALNLSDDPITDTLPTIRKVDGNGNAVAGAKFKLEYFKAKSASGTAAANVTGTSGADGTVAFDTASWPWKSGATPVLPLGTVRVTETEAAPGYLAVSGTWTRTSVDDGSHTGSVKRTVTGAGWSGDSATLSVSNVPASVTVDILDKVDVDSGEGLAGAEFSVTNAGPNPVTIDGRTYAVGAEVAKLTTDADGHTKPVKVAVLATYAVRETKAPEGHLLNAQTWKLYVNADGSVTRK